MCSRSAISRLVRPSMRLIRKIRAVWGGRRSHNANTSSISSVASGESLGRVEKIAQRERLPRPGFLQFAQVDAVVKYLILPQPVQALVVGHRKEVGRHLGAVQAGPAPEELVEDLLNDIVTEVPAAGHAADIGAQPRIKSRKHLFYLLFGIPEIWDSGMKHLLSGKLTAEQYPKPYLTNSRAPYKLSRSGRSPEPRPPSRPAWA